MNAFNDSGTVVPFKADLQHYLSVRTPPEQHMAYAATWFVLTGLMSYIAYRQVRNVGKTQNIIRSVKKPSSSSSKSS